ncbi:N-acetylmuramoyl-L-alanine amidase [Aureimonas flava]|uniref:N-acetylmuramoyl-L-alanine amidase n=1 Tax=Aureimonas flava TaxID=2320271 RepID=A0A3A1WQ64_9HYPH|nr:N-acetylmuramoyl-L-alanine amidase [Aureimonas flava]RIX98807.1 N-acetylmuramoyl-L-alanine amidase [Aureimonas flava]
MTPDSPVATRTLASPHHDARRDGLRPEILLLHYTGMESGAAALRRLSGAEGEVSSHYLVEEDGCVFQLVAEERRAWHAGVSWWRGRDDVNSRSIGVEIVNPGHEHGYRPFPARQIEAVIELCRDCVARWSIAAQNVLAHSDVAPTRKQDPGELFPWDQLFRAGIGHWVAPAVVPSGRFLTLGDRGQPVEAYQGLLAAYGYRQAIDGTFDEATRFNTFAFQRHFRPGRVDGVADMGTIATLHRLLTSLPSLS